MLVIDGSFLEGGGQIIRTAIALSALTEKPVRIENIRAGRRNPGLQAQHIAAVKAVGKLCNAQMTGIKLGSTSLEFYPSEMQDVSFSINVGTAGSITLVLQALMLASLKNSVRVLIRGGTMVRWSPTIYYSQNVFLPTLQRHGYSASITLHNHGFYPKGGGSVEAILKPSSLAPINLIKRGRLVQLKGMCTATTDLENKHVAERMQKSSRQELFKHLQLNPEIKTEYVKSDSSGCGIDLAAVYENSVIGSSALGEYGKRSEKVAQESVDFLLQQTSVIDEHLADQLIPYMALASAESKKESRIKTSSITKHARTNIWVCQQFLPIKFEVDEKEKIISMAL